MGYEIINLGSDRPVVLADVITMIEDCLEKKATIEYALMRSADVQATWADIRRAEQLMGWRPRVPIEEGVRRTVEWYQENREWAKDIE